MMDRMSLLAAIEEVNWRWRAVRSDLGPNRGLRAGKLRRSKFRSSARIQPIAQGPVCGPTCALIDLADHVRFDRDLTASAAHARRILKLHAAV